MATKKKARKSSKAKTAKKQITRKAATKKKAKAARKTAKKKVGKKTSKKAQPTERYEFKRYVNCPRCQAPDTVKRSTQGRVQYRRCVRGVCRENFKVIGTEV